jgi:hypothetical protein
MEHMHRNGAGLHLKVCHQLVDAPTARRRAKVSATRERGQLT